MTFKPKRGGARPGSGPKPKGDSPYEVAILLRVTKNTNDSLRAWASVEGVQRTDIARRAIEKYLLEKSFITEEE